VPVHGRELESDRRTQCSNDLIAMKIRRIRLERLVFLDESGLNLSTSRSHAINRVPMKGARTTLPMDGFADHDL
jgi:hypothetical protein